MGFEVNRETVSLNIRNSNKLKLESSREIVKHALDKINTESKLGYSKFYYFPERPHLGISPSLSDSVNSEFVKDVCILSIESLNKLGFYSYLIYDSDSWGYGYGILISMKKISKFKRFLLKIGYL